MEDVFDCDRHQVETFELVLGIYLVLSKGDFSCLTRNSKTLYVSKAKNLDWICLVEN